MRVAAVIGLVIVGIASVVWGFGVGVLVAVGAVIGLVFGAFRRELTEPVEDRMSGTAAGTTSNPTWTSVPGCPLSGRPTSVPGTRDILRLADGLLRERLQLLGFARRSRGIYELDVYGWLGLNESLRGEVRLWPFVGVLNHEVDETLSRLGAPVGGAIATVQLGYLMPEAAARAWLFEGDLACDEVTAADLALNVERYAVPFFEQNRDLRNLSESVARNSDEDSRAYLEPVLHYLLGAREIAERSIDEELRTDHSTAGSEYRELVARFSELLRADH